MTAAGEQIANVIAFVLVFSGAMALYFLPTIVARRRTGFFHEKIFLLNFFAGWTAIGWLASIVWAGSLPPKAKPSSGTKPSS